MSQSLDLLTSDHRRSDRAAPAHGVPGRLVALPAVASGTTVANLYYAQPLLSSLRDVFHISTATAGTLITLTQVGYVIGMLFLVPLGGALGSQLGSIAYRAGGWGAVSILGAALPLPALLYRRTEHRAARRKTAPVLS
ncbi:hypothetical protein [Streptomyces olivaceoviridis]|uniref:hypothetical protein n=1 Tax=Streptomyces olivaceoviridis TaxID=1921 RepID=UPI0036F65B06